MSEIAFIVGSVVVLATGITIIPAIKIAMEMAPFLYLNTKCSARAGLILQRKFYDELLSASYAKELYTLLEGSYYSYVVEHAKTFEDISKALDEDIYNTYKWLKMVVPDKFKPLMNAVKLKFEIEDMKELVNNLKLKMPIGELHHIEDEALKLKLENVRDFESLRAIMDSTPYGSFFSEKSVLDLTKINSSLDKYYYEKVLYEIKKIDEKSVGAFNEYWRNVIDLINIRLTIRKIRSKKEDVEFIDGGAINLKELSGITDKSQLESTLGNSPYSQYFTEMDDFSIENAFYKFLKYQAGNLGAKFTLKDGSLVKYIIFKEIEIRNLNILLKLKQENIKQEEIQKYLVI